MTKEPLRVIAHLVAKDGKEQELGDLLRGLVGPTRAEPGCTQYDLWQSSDNPGHFTFVETWNDEAALDAHFETEHMKVALEQAPTLLAEPLDLRKYRMLD